MRLTAWLTALFTLSFAVAPFITAPFTGYRDDQLPLPQIDPPIQPAGYAFSIWGVIYLWLVASALFGAFKRADAPSWHPSRPWLIVSLGIGTVWLAIANASAFWATVTIFMMLLTALTALARSPQSDRLWLRAPLGLYAGWLSAASFVSLGVYLAGNGILTDGVGWALALIPTATVLAAAVQMREANSPEYGIAVVWALIGIVISNALGPVAAVAGIAAALIAILAIRSARRAT